MAEAGAKHYLLSSDEPHYAWDNALPPKLVIQPGDSVTFDIRDSAEGALGPDATLASLVARVSGGHPLTGPVYVEGARPGDTLQVDVLEVTPARLGWTIILPGFGLLSEEFPEPYLRIWDLSDGRFAALGEHIRVPLDPFCGVLGVAPAEPGEHDTMPPRAVGGNMDVKQLVAGSTLYLPIAVDGALFSASDVHAAQGDGEVCVSAIETAGRATFRFDLRRDRRLRAPQFFTPGTRARGSGGPSYVTTAHGPDLLAGAKQAVRSMVEHLVREYGLTREDAYVLCSVAVDLKISEVVDAPNWIVSAFLPLEIFV